MAFNTFTLNQLRNEYGLVVARQQGLFSAVPPTAISDFLRQALAQNAELGLRSRSEKARSEYIIAPILAEVYAQSQQWANLFSGVEFKVDEARGLSGYCDFIFTLDPVAIDIQAPVVSIVEAK